MGDKPQTIKLLGRKKRPRENLPDSLPLPNVEVSETYEVGTTVGVDAGFLAYVDIKTRGKFWLFLRTEAINQLDFLVSESLAFVHGPPGAGKSVVAWFYAETMARGENKKVLWQHRDKKQAALATSEITKNQVTRLQLGDGPFPKADILILDGQSALTPAAKTWLDEDISRQMVIISSEQFEHPPQDFQVHEVMSWTEIEYKAALQDERIRAQVFEYFDHGEDVEDEGVAYAKVDTPNEGVASDAKVDTLHKISDLAFQAKYFLAGGSCRLMFHKTPKEVVTFLDAALERSDDVAKLASGLQGPLSKGAANSLLQVTKHIAAGASEAKISKWVVSQYAMRQLGGKIQMQFIQTARTQPQPLL